MSSGCQRVLINYLQLLYREVNWFYFTKGFLDQFCLKKHPEQIGEYFVGKIVRGNPWLSKKVGGYFT